MIAVILTFVFNNQSVGFEKKLFNHLGKIKAGIVNHITGKFRRSNKLPATRKTHVIQTKSRRKISSRSLQKPPKPKTSVSVSSHAFLIPKFSSSFTKTGKTSRGKSNENFKSKLDSKSAFYSTGEYIQRKKLDKHTFDTSTSRRFLKEPNIDTNVGLSKHKSKFKADLKRSFQSKNYGSNIFVRDNKINNLDKTSTEKTSPESKAEGSNVINKKTKDKSLISENREETFVEIIPIQEYLVSPFISKNVSSETGMLVCKTSHNMLCEDHVKEVLDKNDVEIFGEEGKVKSNEALKSFIKHEHKEHTDLDISNVLWREDLIGRVLKSEKT